jgi:hypothetical protein
MKYWIIALPLLSSLASNSPIAAQTSPQSCIPLQVVGGNATQVQKKVSLPGAIASRSNWNTDFVVPGNQTFQRYVATIEPLNRAKYSVQMFLKYSNGTADQVYNQTATLPQNQAFTISGAPRVDASPYQVNVSVGGVQALGNTYKLSVSGCP